MKKLLIAVTLLFSLNGFSQTDTASASAVLSQLDMSGSLLKSAAGNACNCIEKIKIKNKSSDDISKAVAKCIEKETSSYKMMAQLTGSLTSGQKTNTIYINPDPKVHNKYYFAIEERLRDSCEALATAMATDKSTAVSMSSDKTALKYYRKGQTAMTAGATEEAVDYFKKALAADSIFSFAWDNLGISLRRLERYEEAITAYKRSIAIDPVNPTPLQNLPIVYSLLKQYDKAIESYKTMMKVFPENAEGYYGTAQIYMDGKKEYATALGYACKAYNLYINSGSPYRTDAQKMISIIYVEMTKSRAGSSV